MRHSSDFWAAVVWLIPVDSISQSISRLISVCLSSLGSRVQRLHRDQPQRHHGQREHCCGSGSFLCYTGTPHTCILNDDDAHVGLRWMKVSSCLPLSGGEEGVCGAAVHRDGSWVAASCCRLPVSTRQGRSGSPWHHWDSWGCWEDSPDHMMVWWCHRSKVAKSCSGCSQRGGFLLQQSSSGYIKL